MLKIRLQRVGRKHDPSFRVVITDSENSTKSGKFLEVVGHYDARKAPVQLNADRIKYWISVGAQPTGTVRNLLVDKKIVEGKKVNVLPKRKPTAEAPKAAESAPAEAPAAEPTPAAEEKVAEPAVA